MDLALRSAIEVDYRFENARLAGIVASDLRAWCLPALAQNDLIEFERTGITMSLPPLKQCNWLYPSARAGRGYQEGGRGEG